MFIHNVQLFSILLFIWPRKEYLVREILIQDDHTPYWALCLTLVETMRIITCSADHCLFVIFLLQGFIYCLSLIFWRLYSSTKTRQNISIKLHPVLEGNTYWLKSYVVGERVCFLWLLLISVVQFIGNKMGYSNKKMLE